MKLVHLMQMKATVDAPIEIGPMPIGTRRIFNATGGRFEGERLSGEVLPGGGEWFLDCSAEGPNAQSGNPGSADCTINVSTDDFQKLLENPEANGMQLFFAGKLKVQGNQMLAMKLKKLFALRD